MGTRYRLHLISSYFGSGTLAAPARNDDRNLRRELREGLPWAWTHRFMRSTSLLTVWSRFVINGLFLLLVAIVRKEGGSPTLIGIMLGIGAVGDVLGSLAAP